MGFIGLPDTKNKKNYIEDNPWLTIWGKHMYLQIMKKYKPPSYSKSTKTA